ncbi:3-hydroxyisobutyrate dehydrogenase [Sneathiella chinensis]|uniref:3-hydroxyisobutyrate dehydrogenase n=1 Tax=Sneathiella chinensis TaxID=349750 RepID=A0ABQ5U2D7_9PROT|nr:3-hydroxyisobutyrate dehydrogenase [Sneathiella chinensis]GLQ05825.1 3-hydroxyisobutyrate dehydrogenase [Sneathiella chinensis]
MAKIGFIGVGNMGGPMAINLLNAGHSVKVFDLAADAVKACVEAGGEAASSATEAASGVGVVISMLPKGEHVRQVYLGESGIIAAAGEGTLFIDCSTIDVATAREVSQAATVAGKMMVDAPVSGGVGGAEAGTLTFMVGGPAGAFEAAKPLLEIMGKNIVHTGASGNGQAAKICNNMILGISMIAVSEAFVLGEKLGLDHQTLFDIASTASGQCWSLTSYCPVPGPVPTSPANNDYKPGFSAQNMLKDLNLSQEAADGFHASTALGHAAMDLYEKYVSGEGEAADFSGIINMIRKS